MKTKTLHDVYFKALNFNERVVVTRHSVERLIERKTSGVILASFNAG